MNRFAAIILVAGITLAALPQSADAQEISTHPTNGGITLTLNGPGENGQMSAALKILLLLTALAFAPAILVSVTSFTRIVIVLSFARQAMGTQQTPPSQVMVGMALFLTLFTMGPTASRIQTQAIEPYMAEQINEAEAFSRGADVLKGFMLRNTRPTDLALFFEAAKLDKPEDTHATPLRVLIPAFILSELKTAFQMGFLIFIPFLLVDLVVSSVLMAMGMMMMSPMLISLPLKILLFVLVDGWHLLIGSIIQSYA